MPTRVTPALIDREVLEGESYACVIQTGEVYSFRHFTNGGLYARLNGMSEGDLRREAKTCVAYLPVIRLLEKRGVEHNLSPKVEKYRHLVERIREELDEEISASDKELREILSRELSFS